MLTREGRCGNLTKLSRKGGGTKRTGALESRRTRLIPKGFWKRCWQGKRSVVRLSGCFDEAAAREGKRVNRKDKGKRSKPKRTWKKMLTNGTECGKIIRHHKRGRWAWATGARQRLAHCKLNNAEKRQKTLRFYLRFESRVLLDNDSLRASSKKAWSEGDLAWW